MGFSMKSAMPPKKTYSKEKLVPGRHLCRVLNVREKDGHYGHQFFLDFEVVEGPSGKGFQGYYKVNPDEAKGNTDSGGKMQKAVAAVYGYPAEQADKVDDAVYDKSIAQNPVSPLRGRLVVIEAIAYERKRPKPGEPTSSVYYEVYPHLDGTESAEIPAEVTQIRKTPALPTKAAPKPTFEDAMKTAGYVLHEADADFCHPVDANGDPSGDVIETAELRKRLGF
jgi:hypothetical protein